MRHFISAVVLAACNLLPGVVCGQMRPLKTGDAFPDVVFNNVYNYSKPGLKFSELRPKLVILDFWSTTCIGCIKAFPKIQKLQQEFSEELQVVMITKESKSKIDSFFSVRPKLRLPNVIQLTSDTLIHELFPRATISLGVWIDSIGKIAAITEGFEANPYQVRKFLSGKDVDFAAYKGKPVYRKTLFDERYEKNLKYFSYLANYDHVNAGSHLDSDGIHMAITGSSAVNLFKVAFSERGKHDFYKPNRLILEIKDSFKYLMPKSETGRLNEWLEGYCYTYQLFIPQSKKGQEYKIMQQDLLRYFDLEPRIEKRTVPGLALIKTSTDDLLSTKGGKFYSSFRKNEDYFPDAGEVRKMVNVPFSRLHNILTSIFEYAFGMPVVDSTNFTGNIDIEVSGKALDMISNDISSAELLRSELRRFGLELIPIETEIEVLILREQNRNK